MADEPLDQRLQLVISKGQIGTVDEWRRQQPDLPSRSEAIRRLIELGLGKAPTSGPSWGRIPSARKRMTDNTTPRAKKPASHRQATAARSTKLAQIRAMRERGLDEV